MGKHKPVRINHMNPSGHNKESSESSTSRNAKIPLVRSQSLLGQSDLESARAAGTELAFDPLQGGWVPAGCHNDMHGFRECRPAVSALQSLHPHNNEFIKNIPAVLQNSADEKLPSEWGKLGSLSELVAQSGPWIDELLEDYYEWGDIGLLNHLRTSILVRIASRARLKNAGTHRDKSLKIHFRPWSMDDLDQYQSYLSEPAMWEKIPDTMPDPFDRETAKMYLELSTRSDRHHVTAIECEGEVKGQIRLLFDPAQEPPEGLDCDLPPQRGAEISFWISRKFWGQGFMKHALNEFMQDAFKSHQLDFIYAWIHPLNPASVKAVENCGFVRDPWVEVPRLASASKIDGYRRFIALPAHS